MSACQMTKTSPTGEFAAAAVYAEMCLSSLVTQRPLEEFCCSATFLDLSLSPLTAGRLPASSPYFPLFTPSPSRSLPVFLLDPSMWIVVSFSCVRRPRQCDSSLSACLIRKQPAWSGKQQERRLPFSSRQPGNCEISSANTSQPDHHLA